MSENEHMKTMVQFTGNEYGRVAFTKCDVSQEEDIKTMIQFTLNTFGRIDCLINNAGWHPSHQPIDDFSVEVGTFLFENKKKTSMTTRTTTTISHETSYYPAQPTVTVICGLLKALG